MLQTCCPAWQCRVGEGHRFVSNTDLELDVQQDALLAVSLAANATIGKATLVLPLHNAYVCAPSSRFAAGGAFGGCIFSSAGSGMPAAYLGRRWLHCRERLLSPHQLLSLMHDCYALGS